MPRYQRRRLKWSLNPRQHQIELPARDKKSDDTDLVSRVRNPRQAEAIRDILFTHNQPGKVNYFEYVTGDQKAKDLRDQLVDILRSGRWTIGSVESEPGENRTPNASDDPSIAMI
jgi:hypothetical protein